MTLYLLTLAVLCSFVLTWAYLNSYRPKQQRNAEVTKLCQLMGWTFKDKHRP